MTYINIFQWFFFSETSNMKLKMSEGYHVAIMYTNDFLLIFLSFTEQK